MNLDFRKDNTQLVMPAVFLIAGCLWVYLSFGRLVRRFVFRWPWELTVCEYSEHLIPLRALLLRRYWRRTWIIQEIAHAKCLTLWCGNDSMAWAKFVRIFLGIDIDTAGSATTALSDVSSYPDPVLTANAVARYKRSNEVGYLARHLISLALACCREQSILDLTTSFRYTECEDERDSVYALLSLDAGGQAGPEIVLNYRLSLLEVATEVLRARLPQGQDNTEPALKFIAALRLRGQTNSIMMRKLGYSRLQYYKATGILQSRTLAAMMGLNYFSHRR